MPKRKAEVKEEVETKTTANTIPIKLDEKAESVKANWKLLDIHLTTHFPSIAASLLPGASEEELLETEKNLGRKLPSDIRQCYLIHNGQDSEKLEGVEDALFLDGAVFLSLAECENHRDGGNLSSVAEGLQEEDEDGKPIPKKEKTSRGKGGKGLGSSSSSCSVSALFSFASSEGLGFEESSSGYLLGYIKGATAITAPVVLPWSFQDSISVSSSSVDFATWFSRFVNKLVNTTSTSTSDKLAGWSLIITGMFSVEHETLTYLIQRHGGTVSQGVTGLTTHMLLGETGRVGMYNTLTGKGSKKYRDAKKRRNIKIITEDELRQIIVDKG